MPINQKGNFLLITGIVITLFVTALAGYFFLSKTPQTEIKQENIQNTSLQQPSSSPELTIKENGSVAFVFISKTGRIGFLKQVVVDPGTWGGLTTAGEVWTVENGQPSRLIDDSPVLDFVWSPDGNKIVYHKMIPSKEQTFFPFIKSAVASGGFAEGDVIIYDLQTRGKKVIGKFTRSDWQTPYHLPKWSEDGNEIVFGTDGVTRYNLISGKSTTFKDIDIRYLSPKLNKAVIPAKEVKSDTFTIRNLKTGETTVYSGLQSLTSGGSVYTYLWSPDNNNLAIIANITPIDPENYNTCFTYILNTGDTDLSQVKTMERSTDGGLCGYGNVQPVWSPNGKFIQLAENMFSIDPENYPLPNLILEQRGGGGPSGTAYGVTWSPDSKLLTDVFKGKLSVYNLETKQTVVLNEPTGNWVGAGYRAWMPDGSKLIYNSNGNLISVNPDGSGKKVLSN